MAPRSRLQLSSVAELLLIFFFYMVVVSQATAWQTETVSDSTTNAAVIAFELNSRGDRSEVYRDDNAQIFLRIILAPGFIKFSPSNCPTLQIDRRVPVHHYTAGPACTLSTDSVNILIATITNNLAVSLPLHRIMNGSQLAVRFVTASGEYRESLFSLRNSKQALQTALGEGVQIEPKAPAPEAEEVDETVGPDESVAR